MAGMRKYESGLFNEFEKLNKKLHKANATILNMSLTISAQVEKIKKLTNELIKANKLNEK